MVGTFYRSPSPSAAPFVEEGDRVETGQTLCVLEAMKLFNELQVRSRRGDPGHPGQERRARGVRATAVELEPA